MLGLTFTNGTSLEWHLQWQYNPSPFPRSLLKHEAALTILHREQALVTPLTSPPPAAVCPAVSPLAVRALPCALDVAAAVSCSTCKSIRCAKLQSRMSARCKVGMFPAMAVLYRALRTAAHPRPVCPPDPPQTQPRWPPNMLILFGSNTICLALSNHTISYTS